MQKMGLNDNDRRAFEKALASTHERKIEVAILDLNGSEVSNIDTVILSGQVTVDLDAEVTRTASIQFHDPKRALSFDTNSPDEGALFADRMLRIRYGVVVPELRKTVWCPVFVGPVTRLTRSGDTVTAEAQGKEVLVRRRIWIPLTLKKGAKVTAAIRTLMRERAGETRFSIPDLKARLPAARSLTNEKEIWAAAKSLASVVGRQLFYDGAGTLVLRTTPTTDFVFRDGVGGTVLSDPTLSYELSDVVNTIEVIGKATGADAKKKKDIRGTATADADHMLSPWRLGPNGGPRYLVETITNDSIHTDKAATAYAKNALSNRLSESVDVSFDALPVPHLEPGDQVTLKTDSVSHVFTLRQFTIPLTGGSMSVGYNKRISVGKRKRRKGSK